MVPRMVPQMVRMVSRAGRWRSPGVAGLELILGSRKEVFWEEVSGQMAFHGAQRGGGRVCSEGLAASGWVLANAQVGSTDEIARWN